jgi:hypothetical protein
VTEDSDVKFDIEKFGNIEESGKMIEAMRSVVFKIAEKNIEFRNLHIGIAQEAADKHII